MAGSEQEETLAKTNRVEYEVRHMQASGEGWQHKVNKTADPGKG